MTQIFDVFATGDPELMDTLGRIPLSLYHDEFQVAQQRYWRLPTKAGPMLAALLEHIGPVSRTYHEEIQLAKMIGNIIGLQKLGLHVRYPSSAGGGVGPTEGDGSSGPGGHSGGDSGPTCEKRVRKGDGGSGRVGKCARDGGHLKHQQNNGVLWAAMVGMYCSILSIAPAQLADEGMLQTLLGV
jgi:hypothetical protein